MGGGPFKSLVLQPYAFFGVKELDLYILKTPESVHVASARLETIAMSCRCTDAILPNASTGESSGHFDLIYWPCGLQRLALERAV